MPLERVKLITNTLSATNVITKLCDNIPEEIKRIGNIYYIEDVVDKENVRMENIQERQRKSIDSDPSYAIFTSGSTGNLKAFW